MEQTSLDKVSRASLNAQQILDNPLFQALMEEMRQGLIDEWAQESDAEVRELIWIKVQLLQAIFDALEVRIEDYKVLQ